MNLSLKNKFMIPTILLVTFMASAISGTSYLIAKSSLTEKAQQQVRDTSNHVTKQISLWLKERASDIEGFSNTQMFIDAASENNEAIRETAAKQLEINWQGNSDYFELIGIADTNGDLIASSGESYKKKINVKDRSYFTQSMKGEKSFSEVILSKASGNPVYVISCPLVKEGKVTGIIFSAVSVAYMGKTFMDPIKIGKTGYMYATDVNGKMIAYPDKAQILNLDLKKFDFGQEILSKRSGLISYTYKDIDKIVGFTEEPTQKWIIASTANKSELYSDVNRLGIISLILGVSSVICGAIMIFFLAGSIVTPISRIIEILESVSSQVAAASEELSSSGQNLAANITIQANTIQETSANLSEVNEQVQSNTTNLTSLEKMAKDAKKSAEKATESMGRMAGVMKNIKQESQKTFGIIKNIDEIAFQTNLLSLNAAVEAARAGESGAGFAVVAGEVRNLAQKSAESAKNTSGLIESVVAKVEEGGSHLESIHSLVQNLESIIKQVTQVVEASVLSVSHNAVKLSESNMAIKKMDETIQSSASNAEESAAAAEEMSAQAMQMRQVADQLTHLVYGSAGKKYGNTENGRDAEQNDETDYDRYELADDVA